MPKTTPKDTPDEVDASPIPVVAPFDPQPGDDEVVPVQVTNPHLTATPVAEPKES